MSCVLAVREGISQIVHVVSMLLVMMRLGETMFQSSDVNGAVWSGVFELDKSASGVSFVVGASLRPMVEFAGDAGVSAGRDQRRRWSPEVASRSVVCFCDDGGSQSSLVTGYEWVASATLVNSTVFVALPGVNELGEAGPSWVSRIWICREAQRPSD
jgi:hypothetical protein